MRNRDGLHRLACNGLIKAVFFILLMATAFGCSGYEDVTSNPKYQSGWIPGKVYRLTVPCDLINVVPSSEYYFSDKNAGTPVGTCQGMIGEPVADNPQLFSPREVVACNSPAGTRFRVEKLTRKWQMPVDTAYNLTTAQGLLLDGPFKGTLIELYSISDYAYSGAEGMTSPEGLLCEPMPPSDP